MGANQSVDASHVRIWNNLCGIQNPATKAQMLETLLASPEYRNALKQMGVHSFCLQWLAGYNRGQIYQWPYAAVGQQQPRQQQGPASRMPASQGPQQRQQQNYGNELIEHPAPRRAHDYFTECCDLLAIDETQPLSSELIRAAYKKAAVRAHPDRGGNPVLFDAVTRASAYLQKIVDRVSGIRQQAAAISAHVPQTQTELDNYSQQRAGAVAQLQDRAPVALSPKKLDMSLFNQLFEENKLPDPEKDDGYGDWLKTTGQSDTVQENSSLRKKFALDTFNQTFQQESRQTAGGGGNGAYYPSAIILQPTMGVTLGGERPADFTAAYGSRTQFTDLKSAYTSDSTFSQNVASAAASLGSRPSNLKEMERARSAPVTLSAEEQRRVRAAEEREKMLEDQRVRRMAQQDETAGRYHENLQRHLLVNN
jgi:curved DNA-binding protein CbpA